MRIIPRHARVLFVASVFSIGAAHAMEIRMFDRMSPADQGAYIGLLVTGAHKMLVDAGRTEDAAKFSKLFYEVLPGDQMSIGMLILEENIDRARVSDAERYAKDHNAQRLEVEHAMLLSLKKKGIVLGKEYMNVNQGFKPHDPLRKE
jgi:hypothetical protein